MLNEFEWESTPAESGWYWFCGEMRRGSHTFTHHSPFAVYVTGGMTVKGLRGLRFPVSKCFGWWMRIQEPELPAQIVERPYTEVQPTKAETSVQVARFISAIAGAVGTRPMDVDEIACEQLDRILNEPSKSTIVPKDITG